MSHERAQRHEEVQPSACRLGGKEARDGVSPKRGNTFVAMFEPEALEDAARPRQGPQRPSRRNSPRPRLQPCPVATG
jgi:hypothetical protein